ncbi:MAG: ATP-binding cassette domain-containing protein [Symbiobacterium sp.]|uniref:ATP-binding cassette domain-containing protein n=1 Tax=Symbiobacterium sp. TaxID=1971213 RepID=UPI0034646009
MRQVCTNIQVPVIIDSANLTLDAAAAFAGTARPRGGCSFGDDCDPVASARAQGVRRAGGPERRLPDRPTGGEGGLLGHNGAGKSTLLRVATGLLPFESGQVAVAGHPLPVRHREAKRLVGYLPDVPPLYEALTPVEYLEYVAALWRIPAPVARERAAA